ncbi:hypothetical protein L1049_006690 [Liquidambar formosana]|uniref:RNase H type-1 domain-containing protein n=1 Tax=Liquidambar formosana TaxID=63359 RepID=A0AAP0WU23_LIQFO
MLLAVIGDEPSLVGVVAGVTIGKREKSLWSGVGKDPQSAAHTALRYLEEYLATQSEGRKGVKLLLAKWLPPVVGRFKVNADGTMFAESSSVGIGAVFKHVGRKGNEVAHGLAKYAKFVEDVIVWMEETPSCIRDQVAFDLTHLFL